MFAQIMKRIRSEKPKVSDVECLVPDCNRSWRLAGSNQGFLLAAAQRHAYAHWEKYHAEQKHPRATWKDSDGKEHESVDFCPLCKTVSEKEYARR
jgi:hypothetical protein